jgi:hypothetical protein
MSERKAVHAEEYEYETDVVPLSWVLDKWLLVDEQINKKDWGNDTACGAGPFYGPQKSVFFCYFVLSTHFTKRWACV